MPKLPRIKTRGEIPNLLGITNVDAEPGKGYDIVIHFKK